MSNQTLPHQEEFFIYVPQVHNVESLNVESDSEAENAFNRSAHEAWVKIPLAERIVVYAYIFGENEKAALLS